MRLHETPVISNLPLSGGYYMLSLGAPELSTEAKPGQFVHLRIPNIEASSLRRPFSICDAEVGVIKILYKVVGRGTEAMARIAVNETVNVMGPLGNSFPCPVDDKMPLLVAGGYGVAPLYFFAKNSTTKGALFVGGRSEQDILLVEDFTKIGWETYVSTDDGTLGDKGFVTQILDKWQGAHPATKIEIFACGPDPMLAAVDTRAQNWGVEAWLSLDRHMGCGVGACLGCVQKIRRKTNSGTEEYMARVCRDGPIFRANTIVWEE